MTGIRLGLPRIFAEHEYSGLWQDFFSQLGVEVVLSEPTDKTILNEGVTRCGGDACLPLKVLHGHVWQLGKQVDKVFIPRFVYPTPSEAACPKFCALPDILRHNLRGLNILETTVDFHKGWPYTMQGLARLATSLGLNPVQAQEAFGHAFRRAVLPHSPMPAVPARPSIALIGHSYLVQDRFLSMNLAAKIERLGYDVVGRENVEYGRKRQNCEPYQGRLFWGVGVDSLGTALTLLEDKNVKGLIFLTSFACGVDSVVLALLEREARERYAKPCLRLSIDEHTGEAEFDTRLEAFFDMIPAQSRSVI